MSLREWAANHRKAHGPRDDVLPCPSCGSDRTWTTGSFRPLGIYVKCKACGFSGPMAQSREVAVDWWNDIPRDKSE